MTGFADGFFHVDVRNFARVNLELALADEFVVCG